MRIRTITAALVMSAGTLAMAGERGAKMQATGTFDVTVTPDGSSGRSYGRMTLAKQYHGGLEGSGAGEMLSGGDPKAGSAGYVAIETVTGTLDGRAGTFQIMQWGTMDAGKQEMRVGVVPGSGTGALAGLSGTMTIEISPDRKHSYRLEYAVAGS